MSYTWSMPKSLTSSESFLWDLGYYTSYTILKQQYFLIKATNISVPSQSFLKNPIANTHMTLNHSFHLGRGGQNVYENML